MSALRKGMPIYGLVINQKYFMVDAKIPTEETAAVPLWTDKIDLDILTRNMALNE